MPIFDSSTRLWLAGIAIGAVIIQAAQFIAMFLPR